MDSEPAVGRANDSSFQSFTLSVNLNMELGQVKGHVYIRMSNQKRV